MSDKQNHIHRARNIIIPLVETHISAPTRTLVDQLTIKAWDGDFEHISQIYIQAHVPDLGSQPDVVQIILKFQGHIIDYLSHQNHPYLIYDQKRSAINNHYFWFIGNNEYPPEEIRKAQLSIYSESLETQIGVTIDRLIDAEKGTKEHSYCIRKLQNLDKKKEALDAFKLTNNL